MVLGLAKVLLVILAQLSITQAAPFSIAAVTQTKDGHGPEATDDASLWLYLGVAGALVLSGGAFAGLTIALMGQV